jgi:hypothetical protein
VLAARRIEISAGLPTPAGTGLLGTAETGDCAAAVPAQTSDRERALPASSCFN